MLRGARPRVLIVDHDLKPGSSHEADKAAEFSRSLNLQTDVLTWQHGKLTSGIQARARRARYRLLGERCRELGIEYLLTAHSRDDQAETLLMRYDHSTGWRGAAGMRSSAYAPIWPELAQVTLLRPMLGISRESIRDYNRANNLPWIDDISNTNKRFERIRAREYLKNRPALADMLLETANDLSTGLAEERHLFGNFIKKHVTINLSGIVESRTLPPPALLGFLCLIAAGRGGPLDQRKAARLHRAMRQPDFDAQTFAGCQILSAENSIFIGPAPSLFRGRANKPALTSMSVPPGQNLIWDGRFSIRSNRAGLTVCPLWGHIQKLPGAAHSRLKTIPAPFRGALPAVMNADGDLVAVPGCLMDQDVAFKALGRARLSALSDS